MICNGKRPDGQRCDSKTGCGWGGCPVFRSGLKDVIKDIVDFKEAHNQPLTDKLTVPAPKRLGLLAELIREEHREVMLSIFPDWDNTQAEGPMAPDVVNLAKELADLVYVTVGLAIECGIPLDKVWNEVHRSNMSKIGPDGKFVTREDGKILKGPNYKAPDIAGVLK